VAGGADTEWSKSFFAWQNNGQVNGIAVANNGALGNGGRLYIDQPYYHKIPDSRTSAWYPASGMRYDTSGVFGATGDYGYCWHGSFSGATARFACHDSGPRLEPANSGGTPSAALSIRCLSK
jgi:hypothetical protein